jgi:CheY-like chemotaxis protein
MTNDHRLRQLVLVAERDKNVRDLQTLFLNRGGYGVEFVDDGEMALDYARRMAPALLVTEILIPGVDGLTLCRRIRDDVTLRDMPVLVFSILAAGTRAREAGATAFLRKPVVESTFLREVASAIATRSLSMMEQPWPRLSRPNDATPAEQKREMPSSG